VWRVGVHAGKPVLAGSDDVNLVTQELIARLSELLASLLEGFAEALPSQLF
jgi:hypothetical protein